MQIIQLKCKEKTVHNKVFTDFRENCVQSKTPFNI